MADCKLSWIGSVGSVGGAGGPIALELDGPAKELAEEVAEVQCLCAIFLSFRFTFRLAE